MEKFGSLKVCFTIIIQKWLSRSLSTLYLSIYKEYSPARQAAGRRAPQVAVMASQRSTATKKVRLRTFSSVSMNGLHPKIDSTKAKLNRIHLNLRRILTKTQRFMCMRERRLRLWVIKNRSIWRLRSLGRPQARWCLLQIHSVLLLPQPCKWATRVYRCLLMWMRGVQSR